jgi:hypothetical protein
MNLEARNTAKEWRSINMFLEVNYEMALHEPIVFFAVL